MLLPQPLGPMTATNSPRAMSSDTSSRACTSRSPLLKWRVTLRSEIKPALSATAESRANAAPDFRIVAETDDYIVVDKPPALLVHPSKPTHALTLWSELQQLLAFELANGGQVSIVNRLDRETSGLVLVAKTAESARQFGLLMQQQRIGKEYLAIVFGWPEWDEKVVDEPLVRQGTFAPSRIWLKQAIHASGAPATTMLRVEERFRRANAAGGQFSVVRAIPVTGRTHQIRVHLAAVGHPIVGDKIYGPDESCYLRFIEEGWTLDLERVLLLPRHALHSAVLAMEGVGEWRSPLAVDLREWM